MIKRQPAVAGIFYPSDRDELLKEVDNYLCLDTSPRPAIMAVLPHAGYVYSGATAGAVLANTVVPNRVILLGPKHRSLGIRGATAVADVWSFPFGDVLIDRETTNKIVALTSLKPDDLAHREEHSLEVEVPFLWRRNPSVKITPIALGLHKISELKEIGQAIAQVISQSSEPILIATSTDMSHQIPINEAARLDNMAIEQMLAINPTKLYETVFSNNITMCGVIPTTTALFAAAALGATETSLINYTTSAEASGDTSQVVGYAGIVIR